MTRIRFILLFLFSISWQFTIGALEKENIDTMAKEFMNKNGVEGMSIALLQNNETTFLNYGFANKNKNIKTNNNTIYTIASFTKTFTATLSAIAQLEGKLNLDDPFVKYIPELQNNQSLKKITSSHLLGHVSSLPFKLDSEAKNYNELINILSNYHLQKEPMSEYKYSNLGIGIMGYILQNVYSAQYEDLLKEKILAPLKMNSTYLILPPEKEKLLATGHDSKNKIVPFERSIDLLFAAASLKSSIADMAKYMNAQMNSSSFKNETLFKALEITHQNKYCFENKMSCQQLGWQAHTLSMLKSTEEDSFFLGKYNIKDNPIFERSQKIVANENFSINKLFVDKTCSGYGRSGYMVYSPDKKIGVVILLNKLVGNERVQLGRKILSWL